MAVPTVVGVGAPDADTVAITPGIPVETEEDDLLLLFVETDDQAVATPDGWDLIASEAHAASCRGQTFARVADGTEGASVTIPDAGDHQHGAIIAIRGHDYTGRGLTMGAGTNNWPTATHFCTAITTLHDEALIISCFFQGSDTAGDRFSDLTNANLNNLAEIFDVGSQAGNGGGMMISEGEMAVAGDTGDTSAIVAIATANAQYQFAVYPPEAGTWVPKIIGPF